MKATKKIVNVTYCQWKGDNIDEMFNFLDGKGHELLSTDDEDVKYLLTIYSQINNRQVPIPLYDYVIKDDGNCYACKQDDFDEAFDLVE